VNLLVFKALAEASESQVVHAEDGEVAFDGPDIEGLVLNDVSASG